MTEVAVLSEVHERVGLARINRPKALNALSAEVMRGLIDSLIRFDQDPEIGAMVITGNERAFAAGADISEMATSTAVEMLQADRIGAWDRLQEVYKPVIAAVSGWCLGGGNELAMACDMIIASENARFGQPEIELGVIPGAGGTQRLTRAVGKAISMEMVLNNRHLTAQEAYQFGLVNRVVPDDQVVEEALHLGNEIARRPTIAIRIGKEMVNHAHESLLHDGIAAERRNFYFLFSTQDQKEGMAAFLEKREPKWSGD
jgi:enoyl-CoA hydratase